MAASHHGHIICLYAGRAVYCPKMATLQATLKAALECLSLENGREVHFAFPHSDLAILVEISALAFKNVRDGAILYLCDGRIGPTYPHELALQAQEGQARRPARAVTAAPAGTGNPRGHGNGHIHGHGHGQGRDARNGDDNDSANGEAAPSSAAAAARRTNGSVAERSRGNATATATGVRTSNSGNVNTSAAAARAARASRRSRRQTNDVVAPPTNDPNASGEEVERRTGAATDKEMSQPNDSGRNEEEGEEDNAPGPSSRNGSSSSSSIRVKREMMDQDDEDDSFASRNGHGEGEDVASNGRGDPYFKKRRMAN